MIELKYAKKYYGNIGLGLMNESAVINTGEIVGILGENGAGKSTVLKVIAGLTELTSGEVYIDGENPKQLYDKIAFITHEGSYFPWMTPYEYGEFLTHYFPNFNNERYNKLIKFFNLEPYRKIKTFSYGQKAKVEICAGLSKAAEYILMDEPFLGEDIVARQDFVKLLASGLKENETVLISTHHINEIENFIDRAIILRYGRIKADIFIDDIKSKGETLSRIMMEIAEYDVNKYKGLLE